MRRNKARLRHPRKYNDLLYFRFNDKRIERDDPGVDDDDGGGVDIVSP